MIRAKPVLIALIAFFVINFVWGVVSGLMPPSPNEVNRSSYSASYMGYRALYEVLSGLGAPVVRWVGPPQELFVGERRVVLLYPDMQRVEQEKGVLLDAARWVEEGGELVIVAPEFRADWAVPPVPPSSPGESDRVPVRQREEEAPDPYEVLTRNDLLRRLDLEDIRVRGHVDTTNEEEIWSLFDTVTEYRQQVMTAEAAFEITEATGTLSSVAEGVETVRLEETLARRLAGESLEGASGTVRIASGDAAEADEDSGNVIAAEFARGDGSVTLVAEPLLFMNVGLGLGDNSVLAYRLVAGAGDRPIVFDEYYKGGMAIGSPDVLFGTYPYGVILCVLLGAALIWAWSQSQRLGPPLADDPPSRRSIGEYINAMARLFRRSSKYAFILKTCRDGVLEDLRHEMYMPHGVNERVVIAGLERRDPERASRLQTALSEIDIALISEREPSPEQVLTLQERLEACRKPTYSPRRMMRA